MRARLRPGLVNEANDIHFYGLPDHRRRRDFWEVMERLALLNDKHAIFAMEARSWRLRS